MKISSSVHHCHLLLVLLAGVAFGACNQPVKNVQQPKQAVLKKTDKAILLKMVADLGSTLSKKGSTADDGINLLKSYAKNYDFIINGMPKHTPDTGYVYVNVNNDATATMFFFGLPQSLKKQITFVDLKTNYGPWTLRPPAMEPISFGSMFHIDNNERISINVESKYLPEAKENLIEQITVMRLNP